MRCQPFSVYLLCSSHEDMEECAHETVRLFQSVPDQMPMFQIKWATESLRKRDLLGEDFLEERKESPCALEHEYI